MKPKRNAQQILWKAQILSARVLQKVWKPGTDDDDYRYFSMINRAAMHEIDRYVAYLINKKP